MKPSSILQSLAISRTLGGECIEYSPVQTTGIAGEGCIWTISFIQQNFETKTKRLLDRKCYWRKQVVAVFLSVFLTSLTANVTSVSIDVDHITSSFAFALFLPVDMSCDLICRVISPYPGGYSEKKLVGVCGPLPKTLTLYMTKICDFQYPLFQTYITLSSLVQTDVKGIVEGFCWSVLSIMMKK